MNGHQLSGARKFNKHWQSGGGGNFTPLLLWYITSAYLVGIKYSVVRSSYELEFPAVYSLPAQIGGDHPIIGARTSTTTHGSTPHLGYKVAEGSFSTVKLTIKEAKNATGIKWYIAPDFTCEVSTSGTSYSTGTRTATSVQGTPGTWYEDSAIITTGTLSTLGATEKTIYSLSDGVTFTFTNATPWVYFVIQNFSLYYIWDPSITATQDNYESEEAAAFAKVYGDAMSASPVDSKTLKKLLQWNIKIQVN